jgi:hypothetical protein
VAAVAVVMWVVFMTVKLVDLVAVDLTTLLVVLEMVELEPPRKGMQVEGAKTPIKKAVVEEVGLER